MKPCIVMRAHNDMPIIAETLEALHRQTRSFELIVLDNESTDGTLNEVSKYTNKIYHIINYIPGRVLNEGMVRSHGDIVVFLNSDCTPQSEFWLENLLSEFTDERVAAVFGRQIPRPDCWPLYAKDTEETYGDGTRHDVFRNCFSMASSAIRRSVWEKLHFDENLQIAEDIDWTWRARKKGYLVKYAAKSIVTHSHNYTIGQFFRRHRKEGRDEALIFEWSSWQRSLLRYSILPYGRRVVSDWGYCIPRFALKAAIASPVYRMVEIVARRIGFRNGWKEKPQNYRLQPSEDF